MSKSIKLLTLFGFVAVVAACQQQQRAVLPVSLVIKVTAGVAQVTWRANAQLQQVFTELAARALLHMELQNRAVGLAGDGKGPCRTAG